ncbi:M56 family metallopeptidase [Pseudonocardia hydrocarbonoxydans]|uniref:M56 family metallopeptidase n=1 Tax=Pseudonocardia hydrocarbonoxydans TaxID=76726 RepID=UPI0031DBE3E7
MTAAACLIVYGIAVAVLAPRILVRRTLLDRAPTLGVTIWLAAIVGVLTAWLAAVVLAAVDVLLSPEVRHVVSRCAAFFCAAALGAHGTTGQWWAVGAATTLVAGTVGATIGLGRALLRARIRTHRHADDARLIGHHDDTLGAVILDVPERLVYAVAGRPPTVVLSRPALFSLDSDQLAVILAHERAHLAGRHHLVLALSAALARIMPRVRLFSTAQSELARLVEMCADDAAVRDRDARDLLSALMTLSTPAGIPGSALAAAATGVTDRAERLASPPDRAALRRARSLLGAGSVALLAGPALVGAAACGVLPSGL